MGRLDGKVAIVTGSGQGIGRGIARTLAREGAAVTLASRTLARVEEVAREITDAGGRALALECDVFDGAQIDTAVERTIAEFGSLSVLVNNAQGGHMGGGVPLAETTEEMIEESMRGGLYATLRAMRAALPHLKQGGGTIVNLASSTGVMGDPGFAAYGVNKEAIRGLTKHAAREWGKYGITVNVVCPASMTDNLAEKAKTSPKWIDAITRQVPLGRLGDPDDDIAPTVLALATDLHYVTGATLMVDGGRCILR